jgi:hypothetical protein
MQKWEYLFIYFVHDKERKGFFPVYVSDKTLVAGLRDVNEDEAANFLGVRGWEMVSYSPIVESQPVRYGIEKYDLPNHLHRIRMVFKRPKE